jgi:hypothetical protein
MLASGVTLSSDTGEVVSVTWDASLLGTADSYLYDVFGEPRSGDPEGATRGILVCDSPNCNGRLAPQSARYLVYDNYPLHTQRPPL